VSSPRSGRSLDLDHAYVPDLRCRDDLEQLVAGPEQHDVDIDPDGELERILERHGHE
jgi:hypothetical protein